MSSDFDDIDYIERKERFFRYASEDYQIDWNEIESRKSDHMHKLNEMLRNLSAGGVFTIMEMVIFIFEDIYDDPKRLVSYLDKGNNEALMEDIRLKYPEKKAKSTLDLFMR